MTQIKHILVVDDDRETVRALRECLVKIGFLVQTAQDGNEAIAHVATGNFDAMVLDLMMPKRSGLLVLEYLRIETDFDLPIIMITGNDGWRHEQQARLLGVTAYMRKPVPVENLSTELCQVLGFEPVVSDITNE